MLSFAIPAHNEETLLPRTLEAIHNAARALGVEYEIIVADDASTDGTAEVAERHGARVVRIECRQIAAARNAAARPGRGDRVVFLDADTAITRGVLRAFLRAFDEGAAGGGALFTFDGEIPLWARIYLPIFQVILTLARATGGACMFCTRDVFDRTGGFDERHFAAEEVYFARAVRAHGRFVVVRERALTSGRKLRTYSGGEILARLLRMSLAPLTATRSRDSLDLWYGPRREDLGCPIASAAVRPDQANAGAP